MSHLTRIHLITGSAAQEITQYLCDSRYFRGISIRILHRKDGQTLKDTLSSITNTKELIILARGYAPKELEGLVKSAPEHTIIHTIQTATYEATGKS